MDALPTTNDPQLREVKLNSAMVFATRARAYREMIDAMEGRLFPFPESPGDTLEAFIMAERVGSDALYEAQVRLRLLREKGDAIQKEVRQLVSQGDLAAASAKRREAQKVAQTAKFYEELIPLAESQSHPRR